MNKNYLQKYFKLCSKNALKKYRLQVIKLAKEQVIRLYIYFFVIEIIAYRSLGLLATSPFHPSS